MICTKLIFVRLSIRESAVIKTCPRRFETIKSPRRIASGVFGVVASGVIAALLSSPLCAADADLYFGRA